MVQLYLFSGLQSTLTVDNWLNGFDADFFSEIGEGDFFQGSDKDLLSRVNPILNLNSDLVKNSEIRIDTGALRQERIARIRQINQAPYFNIQKEIYNGTGYVSTIINPWKQKFEIKNATNGMQFKPNIEDGGVNTYDNTLQRNLLYKYDSD